MTNWTKLIHHFQTANGHRTCLLKIKIKIKKPIGHTLV